jgi:hypothetical protein
MSSLTFAIGIKTDEIKSPCKYADCTAHSYFAGSNKKTALME